MGEDPLAYFLTWTTYGTWLAGDERGWVAKPGVFRLPNPKLEQAAQRLMTEPELILDDKQRRIVEKTVADHCRIRNWHLHAVNARTKHIHVVVTAPSRHPDEVTDQFKAWCTRKLKEHVRKTLGAAEFLKPYSSPRPPVSSRWTVRSPVG